MREFKIQAEERHQKIVNMLRCFDKRDSFKEFFFSELCQLYGELKEIYEGRIAELDRKILELEKELIFSNLPSNLCR